MDANDIIGKYLIAQVDVPVYTSLSVAPTGVIKKGNVVGPVYSWVERNGKLYWMFDYSIPGLTPGAWYAEHKSSWWKLSTAGGSGTPVTITPTTGIFQKKNLPLYYAGIGLVALYFLTKN